MFDQFTNRLDISGTLIARTALRVGTGRSSEPIGAELPVLRDAQGRPIIPGASLKGVLRSHVESLVRAVVDDRYAACTPTREHLCVSPEEINRLKEDHRDDDANLAQALWDKSCLVCRTFGSPWLSSHIWISDLPVDESTWFGQFQVRDGVAVDRDTGTVGQGLLYDYEVVPAGTRFDCEIVAEGVEDWQLGMVWLGLLPFLRGEIAVGGFSSRGLGTVVLEEIDARYFDLGPEGSRAARLIDYVVSGMAGNPVDAEKTQGWVASFKTKVAGLPRKEA
jgi:CRISPR-associated RAMP protein (TIGR02581 family)